MHLTDHLTTIFNCSLRMLSPCLRQDFESWPQHKGVPFEEWSMHVAQEDLVDDDYEYQLIVSRKRKSCA